MKKIISKLTVFALLIASKVLTACDKKNHDVPVPKTQQMAVGSVQVYDFGKIKLHAYETKDALADESFILETPDELVMIELAGFKKNITEIQNYVKELKKPLNNVVVAYHPAGGDVYPAATIYAMDGLGEAGLVAGFVQAFGDSFNGNLPTKYEQVKPGKMTIGGIKMNIIKTADAFDIEIPAINVYLTHMVGHNTHNILGSMESIDEMMNLMKKMKAKNYGLILSGHDTPRTIEITTEKINYLTKLKELAKANTNAKDFIDAVNKEFPNYMGGNYLEMSAAGLYK